MPSLHPALASPRPLVFAHRGGSKLGPENTFPAFDLGLAAGADGLELDVQLSRDGIVIVHHDRLLGRTNRGAGPVGDRTAEELAAFGVPTFRAVLERYPHARIIVELKEPDAGLARAAVEDVRRARAIERVCFGSFSVRALRAIRRTEPEMATSAGTMEVRLALYRSWIGLSPGRVPYQVFQVPETSGTTRVVSERFVRLAHKAGLVVQVWTVDEPDDIRRLLEWGVDGIISDRPDIAAQIVGDWAARRQARGKVI
jgi:glycerophosphoryl diester phosphodiesterase